MNLAQVEQIAKAVLYEGYMLYPYRPSSVKNRQRFNFGVLYPAAYSAGKDGVDPSSLRVQCLVTGGASTRVEVRLRFLHLRLRETHRSHAGSNALDTDEWQEAVEREVVVSSFNLHNALSSPVRQLIENAAETLIDAAPDADVIRHQAAIRGECTITICQADEGLFKITVEVLNTSPFEQPANSRDTALLHSLVSAHVVLAVADGDFVSLLEPPPELREPATRCDNRGVWPVLVGVPGEKDTLLASPIILYDYPQIAPESPGDLFDGTEIDEILSLRILTLGDEEKQEIRQSDERARRILERTETMPPEQFMKLHGAVRGLRPVKETSA